MEGAPTQQTEPQNGIEKPLQEVLTLSLGGKEYNLDVIKSNFEYPKSIQKESGVLGYERRIINPDLLIDTFKKVIFGLKDSGQPMEKWELAHWEEFIKKDVSNFNELKAYLEDEERKSGGDGFIAQRWSNLLINPILESFSADKYPNQTFNHRMGADVPTTRSETHQNQFKDDHFFLQKIYDLKTLKKFHGENSGESDLGIPMLNGFRLYTGSENDAIDISSVTNTASLIKAFDDPNQEKIYAISPEGLNTKYGHMWGGGSRFTPSFGFSAEDPLYYEYLCKSLELYSKLCEEDPITYLHPITNIVAQMITRDENLRRLYEIRNTDGESSKLNLEQYASDKINLLLKEFRIDFITDENVDKYIREKYQLPERYKINAAERIINEINEPDLPIIINNEKIQQLSWGHAKYAHMYTAKGLNYFELKHADKLPDPHASV